MCSGCKPSAKVGCNEQRTGAVVRRMDMTHDESVSSSIIVWSTPVFPGGCRSGFPLPLDA